MARADKNDILPRSLPPARARRSEAAAYIGVSPALFDQMVADGRMPAPKVINTRLVWDLRRLDRAFEDLPDRAGAAAEDEWEFAV